MNITELWEKMEFKTKCLISAIASGVSLMILIIIWVFIVFKTCTSDITCLVFGWLPLLPGTVIEKILFTDTGKTLYGIHFDVYISFIFWFIIGAILGLIIFYIKQIKKSKKIK